MHFRTLGNILNQSKKFKLQSVSDDILSKFIFAHVNIFYCFGDIVLTLFAFQATFSFSLTLFYRFLVSEVFSLIKVLVSKVNFGWLIRSLHRWSLFLMVLAIFLHIFRVFFTNNFSKLRELIQTFKILFFVTSVSFGVTGCSLPWDQLGYWASKIIIVASELIDRLFSQFGTFFVDLLCDDFSVF